ncbi:uncharacterized protein LOC127263214 [Andrographis paniculata]|uniref:uncharacterized protein LOC127263214 n=1 Tax=Andrographis paniculata TaxID=175694 RepID=UPI0021E86AF3|nr:uncharacterized protein LOC127263214 [Andrographis paniculata]
MATSAFRSTTRRDTVGGAGRRSRSVSRFSRQDVEQETKTAPRGAAAAQLSEISLDDLALEFFSSSSSWNDNGSDGGAAGRRGRSVSRRGEIGRWASDTASSRRKSRSVSRTRGEASSRPAAAEGGGGGGRERGVSYSGRRRSLSVARHHISDSESEANHFHSSSNRSNPKAPANANGQMQATSKATASNNRKLRRTQSYKDLSISQDGYSSHSSALTDDELKSKDTHLGRNGFEKIIRPVFSQKKREPSIDGAGNGGLYEAMRQELRHAVEEIRTELNQVMGRNRSPVTRVHSLPTDNFETFQDDARTILDSRSSSAAEKPIRARKRSSDRHRMSRRLTEEAEKYLEDFISNVEDTDMSSFDGERSDGTSTIEGSRMPKDPYKSSTAAAISCPGETDGVVFPWLQWETIHDASPSTNSKIEIPVTPKLLRWETETDTERIIPSGSSSRGSWSPALFQSRDNDACRTPKLGHHRTSCHDMEGCLNVKGDEELLFEVYRQRSRIDSGRLLLCTTVFH